MADTAVTLDAIDLICADMIGDRTDKAAVAVQAVFLQDQATPLTDLNRLMKILEREAVGVPEAVLGLGNILGSERRWDVATIACGDSVRWLAATQPSYCSRMMWQLTQARGSSER